MVYKKYTLGCLALLLYALPTMTHQATQLAARTHAEQWNFLEQRMHHEPSELAKSYFERYFNWALPTACFWASLNYYLEPKFLSDRHPYCDPYEADVAIMLAHQKSVIAAIVGIFFVVYTSIRNCHYLVRAAEKEMFIELLDNWETTKERIPNELVSYFQMSMTLRRKDPANFNKGLPQLVKGLKERIERHKNLEISKHKEKLHTIPAHKENTL